MPTKVNIVGKNIFDNTRLEMNVWFDSREKRSSR